MRPTRFLTGITTSGTPHLGNYVGSIRPSVRASLRDALLDDDAKEAAMQVNARALFAKFIHLTLGLAFALLVPVALIWGVSLTGIVSFETVMAVSLTWPFLLAGGILFIVVLMLGKRQ